MGYGGVLGLGIGKNEIRRHRVTEIPEGPRPEAGRRRLARAFVFRVTNLSHLGFTPQMCGGDGTLRAAPSQRGAPPRVYVACISGLCTCHVHTRARGGCVSVPRAAPRPRSRDACYVVGGEGVRCPSIPRTLGTPRHRAPSLPVCLPRPCLSACLAPSPPVSRESVPSRTSHLRAVLSCRDAPAQRVSVRLSSRLPRVLRARKRPRAP